MKRFNNINLRLALIAIMMCVVGVQDLRADQGVWKYNAWNKGYWNQTSSMSYNGQDGTDWGGTWKYYDDENGMHVYNNCNGEKNSGQTYMTYHIVAYAPLTAPAYCKVTRSASVAVKARSSYYYSIFQVFFFDDEATAKSTSVNVNGDSRSSINFTRYVGWGTGGWGESSAATTTYTCDNSNGSTSKTVNKYLLFVGNIQNGNRESQYCDQEGGFLSKGNTDTYLYYKQVTFDANGGTGTMSVQSVGGLATLTANAFTKTGYVFKGWSTSASGDVIYEDCDVMTADANNCGPVTLYAQWEEAEAEAASVSFAWNQLKGYQASSDYNTNNFTNLPYTSTNSDWTQTGNSFTYTPTLSPYYQVCIQRYNRGYWAGDLIDWFTMTYTVPSYSSVTFTTGWCVQAAQTDSNSRSSVRAAYFDYETDKNSYWSARSASPSGSAGYKTSSGISFGTNGGQVWNAGTYTYYGENAAAWIYRATNYKGYVTKVVTVDNSAGADSKSESRYGAFSSSKSVTSSNGTFPHWTHLKAKSGGMVYTYYKIVTFDANGGTGAAMAEQKVATVQGASVATALSANTYIKTGQKFTGWNTQADGKGTAYADCSTALTASASDKGPVTLYAQWESKVTTTTDDTGKTKISLEEHVTTEDVIYTLENLPENTKTITTVDISPAEDITGDPSDIIDNIRNNPKSTPNTLIILPVLKEDQSIPLDKSENVIVKQGDDTYKCTNFAVTDGVDLSVPYAFTAEAATYIRTKSNRWGTICVPFALTSDDRIQYYTSGTSYSGTLVLNKAATVEAGNPAIFCASDIADSATGDINLTYYNKDVTASAGTSEETDSAIKIGGTFTELKIDDTKAGTLGSGCDIYYYLDNTFYKRTENNGSTAGQTVTIPALRAYILIEK